jgi:hypothetical protein
VRNLRVSTTDVGEFFRMARPHLSGILSMRHATAGHPSLTGGMAAAPPLAERQRARPLWPGYRSPEHPRPRLSLLAPLAGSVALAEPGG